MKAKLRIVTAMQAILVAACLALFAGQALAQTVYRCTDENGALTFQDFPCKDEQSETRMHIKPNVVDASGARANVERQRAITARLAAERERKEQLWRATMEAFDQERESEWSASQSERSQRVNELLDIAEGRPLEPFSRAYNNNFEVEDRNKSRPPPVNHPSQLINCDQAGCWDTQGRRHINLGPTQTHRHDGKVCTRISPNQVQCN